jgi:3-hydroxyisobutyrate dehydrogenase
VSGPLDGWVVGLVGLGNMGTPMGSHVAAAGASVRAHDVDPAARAAFAAAVPGAEVVGSAAEVASGADTVLLVLPDSGVVEAVVTGDGGLLAALGPDTVLVDMSSSDPTRTVALAAVCAQKGRVLVDAPVSGGVAGARAGTLAVMVGGDTGPVESVRPVLEVMGRPQHVGPTGAGHALKSLNNLMSAAHMLASSEAILIGERFGLDPAVMVDVVNTASGRSTSTEVKWPRDVLPGTFGAGFGIRLMVKDLRIALDLAAATGGPARHAASTLALWEQAAQALPPDADFTEIVRFLRGDC